MCKQGTIWIVDVAACFFSGTDVTILKIFSPKIGVFCSNCCYFLQKFDHNIGFCAENWQKSQKIVILTSTPGPEPGA
jgi:hypothetical protein